MHWKHKNIKMISVGRITSARILGIRYLLYFGTKRSNLLKIEFHCFSHITSIVSQLKQLWFAWSFEFLFLSSKRIENLVIYIVIQYWSGWVILKWRICSLFNEESWWLCKYYMFAWEGYAFRFFCRRCLYNIIQ